jgi:carbamoyltransferase
MDVAASIQKVTEEIILRMSRHVHKATGMENLCLAGGVALNCVGNGKVLRQGPFKRIWIQPASGDAGGALGAALLAWYKYLGNQRHSDGKHDQQQASFLGPDYSDDHIESFLKKEGMAYTKLAPGDIPEVVSDLIAQGKVIGWFQGRMEFGPRALGARSIIGDSRNPDMQTRMNLKIKYRESFRPFAPAVLSDKASEWFDLEVESPYMLLVAPVREDKRIKPDSGSSGLSGFEKLKARRSAIPAVTHVDYSARVQTVNRQDNPLYYDLINCFYKKTNCPVVINTSFNVRGEPLVLTPEDAVRCFMRTQMDHLVLGSFLLNKEEQEPLKKDVNWQKAFELD